MCNKQLMDTLSVRKNGFTLVELMLAMSLSLFMLAGLFYSVLGDLKSYESAHSTGELLTKSRMSLKLIRLYVQQAGFRELEALQLRRQLSTQTTSNWSWSDGQRLQGKNAANSFPAAKDGEDLITLRFLGESAIVSGGVGTNNGNVYDCNGDPVTAAREHEVTLYISTDNELVCKDSTYTTVLSDGVEHLHILYGVDNEGNPYKYYNADQVSDWHLVNRVKVAILSAQTVMANNLINRNSYQLFDREVSAARDTKFRQVNSDTILVRNISG